MDTLNFTIDDLEYEIKYFDQITSIKCTDKNQYYVFEGQIDADIISRNISTFHVTYDPKQIFDLIQKRIKGTLATTHQIIFPSNITDPNIPLKIILNTTLPSTSNLNIKDIILRPTLTSDIVRFNKKYADMKNQMETSYKNLMESIQKQSEALNQTFQQKLNAEMARIVTRVDALDGLNIEYASTDDFKNIIKRLDDIESTLVANIDKRFEVIMEKKLNEMIEAVKTETFEKYSSSISLLQQEIHLIKKGIELNTDSINLVKRDHALSRESCCQIHVEFLDHITHVHNNTKECFELFDTMAKTVYGNNYVERSGVVNDLWAVKKT